jgi:hypothetical protein
MSHHSSRLRNEESHTHRDLLERLCNRRYRDIILFSIYGSLPLVYYAISTVVAITIGMPFLFILVKIIEPFYKVYDHFAGGLGFFSILIVPSLAVMTVSFGFLFIVYAISFVFSRILELVPTHMAVFLKNFALTIFDGVVRVKKSFWCHF